MLQYFLKRLAAILPTVFFVTVIIFGLQQLLPGDAASVLAGENPDPEVIAYLQKKMHLDEPLPMRYAYWISGVFHGDLGESMRIQQPVLDLLKELQKEQGLGMLLITHDLAVVAGMAHARSWRCGERDIASIFLQIPLPTI